MEFNGWIYVVGISLSSVITAGTAIAVTWITTHSAERRHRREILFNAAIESWKKEWELGDKLAEQGAKVEMSPIDSHLIHMSNFSDALLDGKLTTENMKEKLEKIYAVSREHRKYAKDITGTGIPENK